MFWRVGLSTPGCWCVSMMLCVVSWPSLSGAQGSTGCRRARCSCMVATTMFLVLGMVSPAYPCSRTVRRAVALLLLLGRSSARQAARGVVVVAGSAEILRHVEHDCCCAGAASVEVESASVAVPFHDGLAVVWHCFSFVRLVGGWPGARVRDVGRALRAAVPPSPHTRRPCPYRRCVAWSCVRRRRGRARPGAASTAPAWPLAKERRKLLAFCSAMSSACLASLACLLALPYSGTVSPTTVSSQSLAWPCAVSQSGSSCNRTPSCSRSALR